VGDSSDNIPGVPGIGEKTAKKLIDKFGHIDHLLDNLNEVDEKVRQKIEAHMDLLRMSQKLVDLNDIPDFKQTFSLTLFENKIISSLFDFYRKLSFNSLLRNYKPDEPAGKTSLKIEYNLITSLTQLKALKEKIEKKKYIAFDIETSGIAFYKSDLIGISISFDSLDGYYIPFAYPEKKGLTIDFTFADFKKEMAGIFRNPDIKKTGHNIKFDILHLRKNRIEVEGVADDSMLMSYLLYPNRRAHKLKDLTLEILNTKQVEYDDLAGKGKNQLTLNLVDIEKVARYCIDDSMLSLKLNSILKKNLESKDLSDLYTKIEIPLINVLAEMEYVGILINIDFLKKATKELEAKIEMVEKDIFKIAGFEFNLNSSQQLGEFLFEKMQLPITKRTRKTRTYSTDIEVLNELKGYPVVEKVINYRTYKKMLSTYLIGLMESIDQKNRVHTSFNQTVTATGRLSSSDPNLQNIPVGEVAGINIRKAFIAEGESKFLLSADYSQIELRVMAHFSEDKKLIQAFERDFDIHQHTADTVFGSDLFMDNQEKRKRAKIINFSILYGSGPYSLSKELGVGYKEAKQFIERYYEKYSQVKAFFDLVVQEAEKNPEVTTIAGRKRTIPEIQSSNLTVKENGKRMAINTVIQGSAADIIKMAMINIFRKIKKMESHLILQVHDELVFEYPLKEEKQLFSMVKAEMEAAVKLKVPLKVSLKKGKNWGEMKPV
jgi:DNA polymerase-1